MYNQTYIDTGTFTVKASDIMSLYNKVYDLPNRYEYLYTKEVNGEVRVWGAYVTYYRYSWDNSGNFGNRDKAILFSGVVGKKFRFQKSHCSERIPSYANRHRRDGYKCFRYQNPTNKIILGSEFNQFVQEQFPDIHEGVSKQLLWLTLKE